MERLSPSFGSGNREPMDTRKSESPLRGIDHGATVSDLISGLAHDIRNPLNLINLTADHLSQQFQPEREDRRKAFLDLIARLKAEVRRLNETVNEALKLCQTPIERGPETDAAREHGGDETEDGANG